MYWLAGESDQTDQGFIRRFSPRFWTLNFPRPMTASLITTGFDSLQIDLTYYRHEDLCGLIWQTEDTLDHPFHRYHTRRDYRHTVLQFRWQSSGLRPLDGLHSPTLTIEGRDSEGGPGVWYVRLWNYAVGGPEDAVITLDFDALAGGFMHPAEADPVWPQDIDRLFISMVPPEFDGVTTGPLPSARDSQVILSQITVTGPTSTLKIGDGYVSPHDLRIANGYDDVYNQTPERVIWNMLKAGYRGWITHYVGMSHYFNLTWQAGMGRYVVDPAKPALNIAAARWHENFLNLARQFDVQVILSLSYEILAENIPEDWQQRAHDGSPARTGWTPPSGLIAPTNDAALEYLRDVFLALGQQAADAGLEIHLQIGEPWWWIADGVGAPHFYDDVTTVLYGVESGQPVPAPHLLASETATPDQQIYLDWLGAKLGQSTLWLRDQIRAGLPTAEVGLLFYSPQVMRQDAPMAETINFPVASWAHPAFDFWQLEDYDFVLDGAWGEKTQAIDKIDQQLGYPRASSHYFAGFNLSASTPENWRNIDRAIGGGFKASFAQVFVWAYPQLQRDGVIYGTDQEQDMTGFHEIRLPVDISFGASGGPQFMTSIVTLASGHEQRNREWQEARNLYDIGYGLRSEQDLAEVIGFFRARAGRAYGFRYKDWLDFSSGTPGAAVSANDQEIGTGDGATVGFQLVKKYDSGGEHHLRTITKPVAGTVLVALDGIVQPAGWQVDLTTGEITFEVAPAIGVAITAGFEFDVPVRFAEDSLTVTQENFRAGQLPNISLIEVRL
ncbi:TIGR02217 family protein [Paremcibacter congregatus]|uniref:phage distal tail protein, Rcc01695 family n=1 Tax=Paremcibacter congregatus TaxID=2043170 RepID=UPI003A8E0BF0